jgi:hypothetical protein
VVLNLLEFEWADFAGSDPYVGGAAEIAAGDYVRFGLLHVQVMDLDADTLLDVAADDADTVLDVTNDDVEDAISRMPDAQVWHALSFSL